MAASLIAYNIIRDAILKRTQDAVIADFRSRAARHIPGSAPVPADWWGRPVAPGASELTRRLAAAFGGPGRAAVATELTRGQKPLPPHYARLGVPVPDGLLKAMESKTAAQRIVYRGKPYLLVGTMVPMMNQVSVEPVPGVITFRLQGDANEVPEALSVVVAVDLRSDARELAGLERALLIANGATLAIALGLALVAARGVLVPVRRLGRAARELGEGALDTRVEVRGRDELAQLATTFNRTAATLEANIGELRAMEAASRRFVADVSHELRTPLTAMTALTDVLSGDDPGPEADRDKAARMVADGIRRLQSLVGHLIEISRYDANTATLVLDDVNVAGALRTSLSVRGWEDGVRLEVPEDLMARLDPRRFDVIVANLVGNALRHGAPPIVVRVRPEARGGRPGFTLTVLDHGPGIPDDLLPLVFDRFVKRDPARAETEGSGLGLSLTRAHAELHGGHVTAENSGLCGAMFTLWLPREQPGCDD
ncbi:sensor histidine kinase [Bailinhaonella thermotolerans]|uniref:histidine kinase n=2 Tax=Bailinhaonella thermotolerans TaxID=1070861 RepID=A0A3A4B1K5_9ACTN|nr:sensor histidine kinase [Bailinhaonella thermotolerans]